MTDACKWEDGHGNTYIGSVYLKSRQHNMQPIEYKTDRKPAAVADVIDKSGYMVCTRRADLKRRAYLLRADRARAAAAASDFTAEATSISQEMEEAKKALAASVLSAQVSGDFYAISERARNLRISADYLDRYNRWKAAGRYQTVASIKEDLDAAREYIRKAGV